MLQTIREHTQGWIAGTIISVIILTFALWGIHSYFVGGADSSNIAEVNGIEINKEQLAVAYERLRHQLPSSQVTANEAVLKQKALQALIDIEVLKQASTAQGYQIFDPQIDNYLQSMPEFQVDGQFSVERFQEILSSTLLSTSEFLDLIKTSLLIDQPKLGIVLTSFALPNETTYTISLVNQERDIQYIAIPLQNLMVQAAGLSTQKIQAYYDQHKKDFMTPEQVNIEYVELALKDIAEKITPTETMLRNFYNENINSYTQPMKWKLASVEISVANKNAISQDEIMQAKKTADSLAETMKTTDNLPKFINDNGGNLFNGTWMTLNQVPEEFQKAVGSLTRVGQVTEPFKTANGFSILKAVDIQTPKIQAFEEVKDKVKESYIHQHAEEKLAELREQLADAAYEHPDSLEFTAKTLNLPIKTSELFVKDKPGKDISQYKKVRDIAFSNDVINLQNNSDVITVNPETMIVLRVKSHVSSTLLPLADVTKQIEEKLKTQELDIQLAKLANNLKAQLQAGKDPQALAAAAKLKWNDVGMIGRYSTKVDSAILDLAFRLPHPSNTQKIVYGVTRLPTGYALVALKAVKNGDVSDKKQNHIFSEQVQSSEGVLEYELYKRDQSDKAKIKINN
ncbi:MAG: SurA N-terminal domain-containing protein [Gammaproteobacteria bacterium]|nr:SurA N-terminal domain-containing protein [Gammaproteobacteria bacterium]